MNRFEWGVAVQAAALLFAFGPTPSGAQEFNFQRDCARWIEKHGYSTDYIKQKVGKRQPGTAGNWRGNVDVKDVQPGDVVLTWLRKARGHARFDRRGGSAQCRRQPRRGACERMERRPLHRRALIGDRPFRHAVTAAPDHDRFGRAGLAPEPSALKNREGGGGDVHLGLKKRNGHNSTAPMSLEKMTYDAR